MYFLVMLLDYLFYIVVVCLFLCFFSLLYPIDPQDELVAKEGRKANDSCARGELTPVENGQGRSSELDDS
jgi:hypothetical protein